MAPVPDCQDIAWNAPIIIVMIGTDFAWLSLLSYPDIGSPGKYWLSYFDAKSRSAAKVSPKGKSMQSLKLARVAAFAATVVALFGATISRAQGAVIDVNDKNFKSEVLNAKEPVFVDFYAVWCGPCKRIAPSVDALATEYEGKVKFVRIDVDQSPVTSAKYDVRSMPIMRIFAAELKTPAELKNYQPKEKIKEFIDSTLSDIKTAK